MIDHPGRAPDADLRVRRALDRINLALQNLPWDGDLINALRGLLRSQPPPVVGDAQALLAGLELARQRRQPADPQDVLAGQELARQRQASQAAPDDPQALLAAHGLSRPQKPAEAILGDSQAILAQQALGRPRVPPGPSLDDAQAVLAMQALAPNRQRRRNELWDVAVETNGTSTLGGTVTVSSATFAATGLSVALPEAGTYLIQADLRMQMVIASGSNAFIAGELYNTTASAAVASTERLLVFAPTTAQVQLTMSCSWLIAVTAASTIALYALRGGGTTFTNSDLDSDTNGRTTLSYVQLRRGY